MYTSFCLDLLTEAASVRFITVFTLSCTFPMCRVSAPFLLVDGGHMICRENVRDLLPLMGHLVLHRPPPK